MGTLPAMIETLSTAEATLCERRMIGMVLACERWIQSRSDDDQLIVRRRMTVVVAELQRAGVPHEDAVTFVTKYVITMVSNRVAKRLRDVCVVDDVALPQN